MITEEEISHQNNNIFDLSHPTPQSNVKLGPPQYLIKAFNNFLVIINDCHQCYASILTTEFALLAYRF